MSLSSPHSTIVDASPQHRFKLLAFDMDGTLIDSLAAIVDASVEAFAGTPFPTPSAEQVLHITALRTLVGATGSLVLALAVYFGRLSPGQAVELATVEERFQLETWGADEELEATLAGKQEDAEAAGIILSALSRRD